MVLYDERDNNLDVQIAQLERAKRSQRRYEQQLKARAQMLGDAAADAAAAASQSPASIPQYGMPNIKSLQSSLQSALPSYMNPSNIGDINKVSWFFWENMTFDFGANPVLTPATRQTQNFQVSQEGAFLIMAITRNYNSYTTAGNLGPWMLQLSDRQSARQFMNAPIPIQMIGTLGNPLIFPTPMLLLPNAFLDGVMSTTATNQATEGASQHTFSFFGYRIRVQDAEAVLGTIFAP